MTTAATQSHNPLATTTSDFAVLKRDQQTRETFDREKIKRAIWLCFQDIDQEISESDIESNTDWVVSVVRARAKNNDGLVGVEEIQDVVEIRLMSAGYTEAARNYITYRNEHEKRRKARKSPDPRAISDYIHPAKYARYLPQKKRRETFEETVDRCKHMHLRKNPSIHNRIEKAFDAVQEKKVLPSMRSMQFGGEAIERCSARIYNCAMTPVDRPEVFGEVLWLLLCGCGVGYSVQWHHVNQLPQLSFVDDHQVTHHVIDDSIEGWGDSVKALIDSYINGYHVEFAYHEIRHEGAPIKSSGGKAPGHIPLKRSIENIRSILNNAQGRKLRPIECHDILCHCADAVLAGGVRRSAMLSLFSIDDSEMMLAKTGEWFNTAPHRGRANNSVVLDTSRVEHDQFHRIFEWTKQYGEPGFYWADDPEHICNPCQPAWAPVLTPQGIRRLDEVSPGDYIWSESGWTRIKKKWSTGRKDVYRYRTTAGVFYGTKNHRVISEGDRVKATEADSIDMLEGPDDSLDIDPRDVMDGLVVGDGSVRRVQKSDDAPVHEYMVLDVGENDGDYFESEVGSLIEHVYDSRGKGAKAPVGTLQAEYRVTTTVQPDELKRTFDRCIPQRFMRDPKRAVGFLRGLYSANGSVCGNRVTLKASSKAMVEDVQLLLSSLGIPSYYTTNKPKVVEFDNGAYECKESYDVNITTGRDRFASLIGFIQQYKMEKLEPCLGGRKTKQKRAYEVQCVDHMSREEVFDIEVESDDHTYWTGGCNVSNCAEIGGRPKLEIDSQETLDWLHRWAEWKGRELPPVKIGDVFSGTQFCCLAETNVAQCETVGDFYEACENAAVIATSQASFTNLEYLGWAAEAITDREALTGVSMMGVMDNPKIGLDEETLRNGAEVVKDVNQKVASEIGINPAARTTCVKPGGKAPLEAGGIAPGVIPHHARRYFRRIIANRNELPYQHFRKYNPHMVSRLDDRNDIITFPIEAPADAKLKEDFSAVDFFEAILEVKRHWVDPGTAYDTVCPGLTHNVSNTIPVDDDEWEEIARAIWNHRHEVRGGITLLPRVGDKIYPNAPYEEVRTEADEAEFRRLVENYTPVDWTEAEEEEDTTDLAGETACSGGQCEI